MTVKAVSFGRLRDCVTSLGQLGLPVVVITTVNSLCVPAQQGSNVSETDCGQIEALGFAGFSSFVSSSLRSLTSISQITDRLGIAVAYHAPREFRHLYATNAGFLRMFPMSMNARATLSVRKYASQQSI